MYKKILVPVDLGREQNAIQLCKAAEGLATEESEIRLLTVAPGYGMSVVASYFPADAQERAMAELLTMLTKLAQDELNFKSSVRVREGKRCKNILQEAEKWGADAIVVGSRRKLPGDGHLILGSCSSSVANRAQCTVMVVRGLPLK